MSEDTIYLTTGPNPKGPGLLAIMTRGQMQLGDRHVEVLTLEVVQTYEEARQWFRQMKIERPWETRQ